MPQTFVINTASVQLQSSCVRRASVGNHTLGSYTATDHTCRCGVSGASVRRRSMDLVQVEYHARPSFQNAAKFVQVQESEPAMSTELAEKVEAMLSTAVLHLADLWNMLTLEFSEGVAFDPDTALLTTVAEIPPQVLTAMKSKLENSLEWCQLARSRLTNITRVSKHYTPIYPYPSTTNLQEPHTLWPVQSPELRTYSFSTPS